MKRNFTNENFEDFLKKSADSLRMKAPDTIWQNLASELGKKRRRAIFGTSIFLVTATLVSYFIINNTPGTTNYSPASDSNSQPAHTNIIPRNNNSSPVQDNIENKIISAQNRQNTKTNKSAESVSTLRATYAMPISELKPVEEKTFEAGELVVNDFSPTVVDSYTEFENKTSDGNAGVQVNLQSTKNTLPLSIESVVNNFQRKTKNPRFQTQFHFSPTISYRKLSENKSYLRTTNNSNVPINYAALYSSVNNMVTHKPDMGFELGITKKYALSSQVKLRGGLQLNINRYDVKAFNSPLAIATIALNNGPSGLNHVNTVTGYSNVTGYESNWLQNFSFQVSAPVGVEYFFSDNKKVRFGVATSVQPTYILGERSYLITTDYKSYTQVPWLLRRWNVNTALETFVTYQAGKATWQLGPQVRYQLLSSFIDKYPVKENLFDFGLKIGVSVNK